MKKEKQKWFEIDSEWEYSAPLVWSLLCGVIIMTFTIVSVMLFGYFQ